VEAAADSTSEPISERTGPVIGRIVRTSEPVAAVIRASAQPAEAPFRLYRLRIGIENTALPGTRDLPRDMALRRSLIAAHVIVRLSAGRFLSLLDPPAWAVSAAAQCVNRHVFPVLAGREDRTDTVLCSPIILYDHPRVAPESPGDLHDATEIDEILTLRTLTLTEAEKVQARATDPRAAAIVDRINAMPPEVLARLHGAIRALRPLATEDVTDEVPWWDPRADSAMQPETDAVVIAGVTVCRGSRVRLRPRRRGTDIQDIFLTGRTALVQKVLHDVDGSIHVAVVLDDAVDLAERRSLHFSPDELEPVSGDTP
jgi:hypothetical protein